MGAHAVPDRGRFRQVLSEMAAKAKAKLPESTGRIDKAVALMLAGDVAGPDSEGLWLVGSCSDPLVTHRVSGTSCSCDDSQNTRAPRGLCKHVLSVMLTVRVREVLESEAPTQAPSVQAHALPEMPASINFKAVHAGFEVQVTLRDTDEHRLLDRLAALLKARTDIRPVPKPAPRPQGQWRQRK